MKRITLWIKTKRKIHNNVGEKEHSTRCHHQHSSYVNLPQISSPPHHHLSATVLHYNYLSTWHKKQISNFRNWISGQEEKCYVPYTTSGNRRYLVCFNLIKIAAHNNLITKYISFFLYSKWFSCFIFTYLYRGARFSRKNLDWIY